MKIVRSLEADSIGFEKQEIFRRLDHDQMEEQRARLSDHMIELTKLNDELADQMEEQRARLSDHMIELTKLNDELAEAKQAHKEAAEPHKTAIKQTLKLSKAGGNMEEVECLKIANWDTMRVKVMTPDGEEVYERAMRPEERQMTIS